MADLQKNPTFTKALVKARGKKRYSLVSDESLINLMKVVGKKIEGKSRGVDPAKGQQLFGIFILPTNNVIEIFKDARGTELAILYNNIDVWMSFELSDLETARSN